MVPSNHGWRITRIQSPPKSVPIRVIHFKKSTALENAPRGVRPSRAQQSGRCHWQTVVHRRPPPLPPLGLLTSRPHRPGCKPAHCAASPFAFFCSGCHSVASNIQKHTQYTASVNSLKLRNHTCFAVLTNSLFCGKKAIENDAFWKQKRPREKSHLSFLWD